MVSYIKNHLSYTETDGEDLGIEGNTIVAKKEAEMKPVLTLQRVGGHVEVSAVKESTQGFEVWSDRGDGNFVWVGFCSGSKFIDNTALPAQAATWKYKGIYHLHDGQAGQWSEVVSVLVSA